MDLPRPFGPYTLLRRLAVGGMAEVYVARARGIGGFEKLVAIKVIHPRFSEDEHFIQMLVEEAKISVLLTHVNIAQIFDLGCIEDTYFIVMEYIEGADTYRMLKRSADSSMALPVDICAFIASEMCNGLDYAHRKRDTEGEPLGIVHRDISPQNVLLSYAGEVKLVDFGIAKAALRTDQTEAGVIKGKYYYMSPEQAWGDPMDHRSDIFSTGVVLYELLTGQMLYQEENIPQLLDTVRKAEIVPPSFKREDVPLTLDEIVLRAVAKRPEDRYQSAHEMGQALAQYLYRAAPHFTAQRVSDLMAGLFEEELRRYGSSIGARNTGERRLPSEPPEPKDGPTRSIMQPDEFAPDPTKSVIFDLDEHDDETRNDVLPYRRRLELEEQRAERAARARARRGPGGETAPVSVPGDTAPVSVPGAGNTRPLRAVRGGEAEPTAVHAQARADDWEDETLSSPLGGSDEWDDSTVVDGEAALVGHSRELGGWKRERAMRGAHVPSSAEAVAPPVPRRVAQPPPPPPPTRRPATQGSGAEPWPISAPPHRSPPAPAAVPEPPPQRSPSLWPDVARADSDPPTSVFMGRGGGPEHVHSTHEIGSQPPQAYPAVRATPPSGGATDADPFLARPANLDTAGWAAVSAPKRSYTGWLLAGIAVVLLTGLGILGGFLFAPDPPPPVLEVISVPPQARVTLDGNAVAGATPVRITEGLRLGQTYRVDVSMEGYETWSTTFQPTQGLVKQIAVLTPERATLQVETVPEGAHVWVDDVLHGSAPIEVPSLPIGREVRLRASKVGYREARETVRVSAGELSPKVRLTLQEQ